MSDVIEDNPLPVSTKECLLVSAKQLLLQHSYTACGVRDIAKHCGITNATMYFHYSSKDAIVIEVIKRISHACQIHFFPTHQQKNLSVLERVKLFSHNLKTFLKEHEDIQFVCLLAPELLNIKIEFRQVIQNYMNGWIAILREIIQPVTAEADQLIPQILSCINGAILLTKVFQDFTYIEQMCDSLVDHVYLKLNLHESDCIKTSG